MMTRHFDPLVDRFIAVLREALPGCPPREIYWSYQFLTGALTLTFAETGRIDKLSGGLCRSSDLDSVTQRLAPYVAAGFRALCAAPGGATSSRAARGAPRSVSPASRRRAARKMKYRHSFHAGNFADVHKHVTLLALLGALKKKDKGLLYLDTHAGRGSYDLSSPSAEASAGIGRLKLPPEAAPELHDYAALLAHYRGRLARPHLYPGSPLLAVSTLRPQDRAVLIELQAPEKRALEEALTVAAPGEARRRAFTSSAAMASSVCAPGCRRPSGAASRSSIRPTRKRTRISCSSPPRSPKGCAAFQPGCSPPGIRSRTSAAPAPGRLPARTPCARACC